MTLRLSTLIVVAITLQAAAPAPETPELLKLTGAVSGVHDPVIIREGEWYYVFATGGSFQRAKDMHEWALCGRVFEKSPEWHTQEIPGTRGGYWAPDISCHKGTYRLYYSVSTFGRNDSAIGLATNGILDPASPKCKWVDQGLAFRSHSKDDFNAIDPNLAVDARSHHWLSFGGFWGGIQIDSIKIAPDIA